MDPLLKMWMFENWLSDTNDKIEIAKNHAYLLGSFSNPEAVKKVMGEDGVNHTLSDEEFDASTKLVLEDRNKESIKKKKKRKLKK